MTQRLNCPPPGFDPARELPGGFLEFLLPLQREFTPRQKTLVAKRAEALSRAHRGQLPQYLPPSPVTTGEWKTEMPGWCQDQRNQMTGRSDDADLVVKMLNSGAAVLHTPELITRVFDEELDRILRESPAEPGPAAEETYRQARRLSEEMITRGEFNPI